MLAFRARYVFPVDAPPISDGVVAIDHDRIVAVGPSNSPALHDLLPAARDLGDVAILPGLINAHTHLELSEFQQPLGSAGMRFPDWIRVVVEHQRMQRQILTTDGGKLPRSDRLENALTSGIEQMHWAGITIVGDIESGINGPLRDVRPNFLEQKSLPFELVNFLEIIALKNSAIVTAAGYLSAALEFRYAKCPTIRLGISPHAPYTVHPQLLEQCAQLSEKYRMSVAHHLAESREELMLLRTGRGPFVKLLEEFDAWDAEAIPFGSKPIDYLRALSKAHRALVIHGNYLDDGEIEFLAAHAGNMSVVYCPRTHAYFQHDAYPLAKMLAAGVNVALGTDSRASNPDLSIIAEMRFAAEKHPVVSPARLLRMITADAARALGRDKEIGTLTRGKFADLAICAVRSHNVIDPDQLLLDPTTCVAATIFRGRAVFGENNLLL